MNETRVQAIYKDGVLHLQEPLPLAENTAVEIVFAAGEKFDRKPAVNERVEQILVAAGLSLPRDEKIRVQNPVSPEEREYLARLFAAGTPISDLVLQERDEH